MKRLSNLFWALVCSGFFLFLGSFLLAETQPIWKISQNYKQTSGKVISYEHDSEKISRKRKISHDYHTISYLKRNVVLDLNQRIPVGTTVPITYSAMDQELAIITNKTSFIGMYWDTQGWFGIVLPLLVLLFGLGILSFFKDFIKPTPDESDN